jgi:predicted aldo/keto reductase-like oxidoreductase
MQYRRFGKTNIMLSALGYGTNRFKISSPDCDTDIADAAELIKKAIAQGVNYIDVANTYSKGSAEKIVKQALLGAENDDVHLTVKVPNYGSISADETYRKVCASLENMGRHRASFFIAWDIKSYEEFQKLIEKGKLYDGALRAQKDGLVDHVCCSIHAGPADTLKIMESGLFEGITISYSVLNHTIMQTILEKADELDIGIVTMNSLGGGLIPQNPGFFQFLKLGDDETVSMGALRFSYAHPQIACMLSGMATIEELTENIQAVASEEVFLGESRIEAANIGFAKFPGFCTGCGYCHGCPEGIDTAMMMQAYNQIYFTTDKPRYNRSNNMKLLENINICQKLMRQFSFIPENTVNPCRRCGLCEKKCTQSIPIVERLKDLYSRFDESSFSKEYIKSRLKEIFSGNYTKVVFYSGGGYTAVVLGYLRQFYPDFKTEIFLVDSSPRLWGTKTCGIEIQNPALLSEIKPDIVIVSQYTYQEEIYESIKYLEAENIKVIKLHKDQDVPWLYNA